MQDDDSEDDTLDKTFEINIKSYTNNDCISSPYLDIDNINIKQTQNQFACVHLNIQSLPSKFDDLKNLIQTLSKYNIELDCILLCETFLTDENSQFFNLPDYQLITKN